MKPQEETGWEILPGSEAGKRWGPKNLTTMQVYDSWRGPNRWEVVGDGSYVPDSWYRRRINETGEGAHF